MSGKVVDGLTQEEWAYIYAEGRCECGHMNALHDLGYEATGCPVCPCGGGE